MQLLAQTMPYVLFGLIGLIVALVVVLVVHAVWLRPRPDPIRLAPFEGHTVEVAAALRGYRATFAADADDPTVTVNVGRHR